MISASGVERSGGKRDVAGLSGSGSFENRQSESQQINASTLLSFTGGVVFYLGLLCLLPGATPNSAFFKVAGWLVTAGWLLQRREANLWPFNTAAVLVFARAVKTALRELLYLTAVVVGSLGFAALITSGVIILILLPMLSHG
jgi:hypothetical protein